MRLNNRSLSACAAVMLIMTSVVIPQANASAPEVTVDESVYVNMDYYGEITDTSIVKGCDLNGNTTFTDYGKYETVTNMSNHATPKLEQDRVIWELGDEEGRFYYECKPKEISNILPWAVDVSYSLDGVPIRADKLAGASGLVQVDINVKPNKSAREYYKNNMMLIAATLVNLEDVKSFRADGAQMQTIGSQKAALFMATPGQETEFSYQVGTDSFESVGTIFLMVPATLSQLDEIQNFTDAKERIEDASDAMSGTLDIVLEALAMLPPDLRETQAGLQKLDQAREIIYTSKDGMNEQNDKLEKSIKGLSNNLRKLARNIDDNSDELENLGDHFDDLAGSMVGTDKALKNINRILSSLKKQLEIMKTSQNPEVVGAARVEAYKLVKELQHAIQSVQDSGNGGYAEDMQSQIQDLQSLLTKILQSDPTADVSTDAAAAQSVISDMLMQLSQMSGNLTTISAAGDEMTAEISDLAGTLSDMGLTNGLSRALSSTGYMLDNVRNMDLYMTQTIKECEDILNEGAKQTVSGLDNLMGDTATGLDRTGEIRANKDIIKQTIDDEWDRLFDDLGILNIDINAEKVSFTSEKNSSPDSIQIILRTQEISIDDGVEVIDAEVSAEPTSIWERIAKVFEKIWKTILSVFKKD